MVFPLAAAVAGAVGIGSSLYSSSQAKKASKAQLAAQQQAEAAKLAAQREAFNTVQGLNQPGVDAGNLGLDALLKEFGLAPGGGRSQAPQGPMSYDAAGNVQRGAAPMAPNYGGGQVAQGGGAGKVPGGFAGGLPANTGGDMAPQGGGYLDANPDVAQFARDAVAQGFTPEGWSGGVIDSPEEAAQYHYETYGQQEGRQMPMGPGQQGPIDYTTAERPNAPTAPQFERPDAVQFGDYGQAPAAFSYTTADIENDPGYRFALSQGLGAVNAASAARGKLRSGDTIKALQDRGSGVAHQFDQNFFNRALSTFGANRNAFEADRSFAGNRYQFDTNRQDQNFGDDRGYGTGLWQFGVNRGDQVFNDARDYQTGRIDQRTNNLFDLAGIGQSANRTIGNAATGFANAQSDSAQSSADAISRNAQNRAVANNNVVGAIGGAATNLFSAWGGGSGGGYTSAPKVITNRGSW